MIDTPIKALSIYVVLATAVFFALLWYGPMVEENKAERLRARCRVVGGEVKLIVYGEVCVYDDGRENERWND